MAITDKGLTVFETTEDTLTFLEYRQKMAGNSDIVGGEEPSNMQKIDALFDECSESISALQASINTQTSNVNEAIRNDVATLIKTDNGAILIGGAEGKPVNINDGTSTASIASGILTVNGAELSRIRLGDFVLRNHANSGRLILSHNPRNIGGEL